MVLLSSESEICKMPETVTCSPAEIVSIRSSKSSQSSDLGIIPTSFCPSKVIS